MKTVYSIQGMTCNGCRSKVEQTIAKLDAVRSVEVSLEREEAVVETNNLLDIAILRRELSPKYTVGVKTPAQFKDKAVLINELPEKSVSKWRQLKPLFLILGYISLASVLLHRKEWNIQEMMLDFMCLFFIVFSFFKLLDIKGFVASFRMYDPLAARLKQYAWVYPFIEVGLGGMLLLRWQVAIAFSLTIIILGITTIGVTRSLLVKNMIQCACLGTALKLPMTEATFIENALMIAMASVMLVVR